MTFLALQQAADVPWFTLGTNEMDLLGGWLICFFTLAVFSFLYSDNPFYKVAEHVFVGAGTAYYALKFYEEGILEPIVDHIGRAAQHVTDGTLIELGGHGVDPTYAIAFRSLAAVFGVMLLTRLFAPGAWAPRWPLAVMVGVYAALKMTGETQSKLVQQVRDVMKPLTNETAAAWGDNWERVEETQVFYTVANILLVVGLLCALIHFMFTYKPIPLLQRVSRTGIVVLMITFGSMFGFTVLGRIALLIERVDQLGTFTGAEYSLGGAGLLLSPPVLFAVLITLVLGLGWMQRRRTES